MSPLFPFFIRRGLLETLPMFEVQFFIKYIMVLKKCIQYYFYIIYWNSESNPKNTNVVKPFKITGYYLIAVICSRIRAIVLFKSLNINLHLNSNLNNPTHMLNPSISRISEFWKVTVENLYFFLFSETYRFLL